MKNCLIKQNNKMDILKILSKHLEQIGFHPEYSDEVLNVCGSSAMILEDKDDEDFNILMISFEVNVSALWTTTLMQTIIEFANENDYEVDIYESFAFINNQQDECDGMLWGEEAEYYYETGELPVVNKKSNKKLSEISTENPHVEADKILEQIHKFGMKSLTKEQKKFLIDYSKGRVNSQSPLL